MKSILQYLIPGLAAIIAIFFYGRKSGLKKKDEEVDAVQDIAEKEIAEAESQAAKATAEAKKAETEARIIGNTAKIVMAHNSDDSAQLMEKAERKDVDVTALVSEILASSRARAQEAKKRYEK